MALLTAIDTFHLSLSPEMQYSQVTYESHCHKESQRSQYKEIYYPCMQYHVCHDYIHYIIIYNTPNVETFV